MESYLPTSDRHAASWIFSDGPSKQLGVVKLRYNALKLFFIMSLFYANVPVSVSDSRHGALRPKQYWPQRVRSVTPHTLNFVRDGIILADLHKSLQIWGWFLPKKIDLPPLRSGNFRGSKNQNSGKCHELSRKLIKKILFTHPTPGGGGLGGQNFKSPVNFMNCRENR